MTGSKSRRKGNRAERDVINWLRTRLFPHAERNGAGLPGSDVSGIHGVTLEIKNHARLDLAGWLNQLTDEMDYDGNHIGAVIHKRKAVTDVGQWYATMPTHILAELLAEAGYGRPVTQWETNDLAEAS